MPDPLLQGLLCQKTSTDSVRYSFTGSIDPVNQYDSRKYHQLKIKRPQVILYTGIVLSVIESLRKPWSCLIISFFTYNNFGWRRYQAALLPFLFRSKYQRSLEKDIRAGTKNLHSTDGSFHHFLQLFC